MGNRKAADGRALSPEAPLSPCAEAAGMCPCPHYSHGPAGLPLVHTAPCLPHMPCPFDVPIAPIAPSPVGNVPAASCPRLLSPACLPAHLPAHPVSPGLATSPLPSHTSSSYSKACFVGMRNAFVGSPAPRTATAHSVMLAQDWKRLVILLLSGTPLLAYYCFPLQYRSKLDVRHSKMPAKAPVHSQ